GLVLRLAARELALDREDLLGLVRLAVGVLVEEAGDDLHLVVLVLDRDADDLVALVDLVDALLEILGPLGLLVGLVHLVPVDLDVRVLRGGPALGPVLGGAAGDAARRERDAQEGREDLRLVDHASNRRYDAGLRQGEGPSMTGQVWRARTPGGRPSACTSGS